MHKKPLTLSIVIPVYNEELYLPSCLGAIASQTLMPDSVIVVDNGSSDKSVSIAQSYPFVSVVAETKPGVIYARDKGFNSVKSDIVARIDADTIVTETWVAQLHKAFGDETVDAVTGAVGLYDAPFARYNHLVDHIMRKYVYLFGTRHNKPFLSGPNMALRKEMWQKVKVGVCRDKLTHEDIDLAIHITKAGGKIKYDRRLRASVSTRRYNDSYKDFRNYMRMFDFTYRRHDLHGFRVHSASTLYWLGYFLVHPLRHVLRISNRLFQPDIPFDTDARKNPN